MAVLVESYLTTDPTTITQTSDDTLAQLQQREAKLRQLDFHGLAEATTVRMPKFESACMLYPELSGKDLRAWRAFLPTVYGPEDRKNFVYTDIPDEVLDYMVTARQTHCFERIEIWSPEGNNVAGRIARALESGAEKVSAFLESIDPMMVGVALDHAGREHYFQIVRWGESLLPMKSIRAHARKIKWQMRALLLPVLTTVLFAAAAFYNSIVTYGYGAVIITAIVGTIVLFFCFILVAGIIEEFTSW